MVAFTAHNGTRTPAGWASYFISHCGGLPGQPSHALTVPPPNASYLTEALRFVGGFPEHMRTAEDTVANTALFALGYGAWLAQDAAMIHHSPCRSTLVLVRDHHQRGPGAARCSANSARQTRPSCPAGCSATSARRYLVGSLHQIHVVTWRFGGDLRWRWLVVSPLVALGRGAEWLGQWREILGAPTDGWWKDLVGSETRWQDLMSRRRRPARSRRRRTRMGSVKSSRQG